MDRLHHIVKGCKSNDRKSQEELYRLFYPAMFTLCKKFFSDEHEIQTALNNGMMKAFKNINQFDSARGSFFNWTYTIVRNACLTQIRDRKVDYTTELKEEMLDVLQYDPFQSSNWEDIFHYLNKLPTTTRAICSLFYLEGFSIKEIEQELEMKEGTIKWHLSESRKKLKDIFLKS